MARILLTFILLANPLWASDDVFAGINRESAYSNDDYDDRIKTIAKQPCNFNEPEMTYNATDLVTCMNDLASTILRRQNFNTNRIMIDRAYQDSRQSYQPSYADYSTFGGAPSNYFNSDDNVLKSLLSGALPFSGLTDLLGGFTRPGFNFFNVLSTVSQYDDLKCVPRILCEVASGSMPGSTGYMQTSGYQDYEKNSIFRLLTSFDVGESSPILSFGRAALLGYTNRGHPGMCYNEYPRCPRSQDQLVSYLNNHNGGFFRLFSGNRGNYYYNRPQPMPQLQYRPAYYKQPLGNDLEYRIVGVSSEYPRQESYLRSEDDRTGTGKLLFDNPDFYRRLNDEANLKEMESSQFIFSKENFRQNYEPNRLIKTGNKFDYHNDNESPKEGSRKERQFFPQNDETKKTESPYESNDNRKPRSESLEMQKKIIFFPSETSQKDTSVFRIPNNPRSPE